MTQAPTPGPLDSESVKLLVKGDLLLLDGKPVRFRKPFMAGICVDSGEGINALSPKRFAFIGRPGADGWMPWSGGENPVGNAWVEVTRRDGSRRCDYASHFGSDWRHDLVNMDIVAFRLAPTAPVEASGSELNPATADLVDRFAAELKLKLAKAEAKYGYAADWLKTDWQDELNESLAEHLQKGDPRDVAAYCAFAWHHGWPTSDVAGHIAPALRPQPSGETRSDFTPVVGLWKDQSLSRMERVKAHRFEFDSDVSTAVEAVDEEASRQALLSARPLALGGQQGEVSCRACMDTEGGCDTCGGWNAPARAEAQDEGAAGEPVGHIRGVDDVLVVDWARNVMPPAGTALYAHPSPTPAADADRVRIAVEALEAERAWHERVADFAFDDAREASEREEETSERDAMRRMNVHNERVSIIGAALATLKSEGK